MGSRKKLVIWSADIGRAALLVLVPFLLRRMKAGFGLWRVNRGKDTLFEALGLRSRGQS